MRSIIVGPSSTVRYIVPNDLESSDALRGNGAMETLKVYVSLDDDTAVLECPHCGTAKTRYVGKFKGNKRNIRLKCTCQSTFQVSLEFRRAYRKETNTQGYYARLPENADWRKILITDISLNGIGLLAQGVPTLSRGDEFTLRFNLDDRRHSRVEKEAVVRWVKDRDIGCQFTTSVGDDDTYDTALNFYLMP